MDTITHIAIGACIGEVLGSRQLGKKAIFLGAAAQSIPDVDAITLLWLDPSAAVLAHRGVTHSILFIILTSLLLAFAMQRLCRKSDTTFVFWVRFVGIQVLVHILLDSFNAYGTGWFEPFSNYRVSFNSLFVADPFYSIPLGVSSVMLVLLGIDRRSRTYWAVGAILISSFYIGYSVFNKFDIDEEVKSKLAADNIAYENYFTTPTPFNNWLWYVVVSNESGSFVGYRSVFDQKGSLDLYFFPRNDSLTRLAEDADEVSRLKTFSQGHYTFELVGDTLVFNDLRFGQILGWQDPRGGFVFRYYLRTGYDNSTVLQRGRLAKWDRKSTRYFLKRIRGLK